MKNPIKQLRELLRSLGTTVTPLGPQTAALPPAYKLSATPTKRGPGRRHKQGPGRRHTTDRPQVRVASRIARGEGSYAAHDRLVGDRLRQAAPVVASTDA